MDRTLDQRAEQVRRQCMGFAVRRAARAVSRVYDEEFRGMPITIGQFSLLSAIALTQPVRVGVLVQALAMERSTVVRNLQLLAAKGLVGTRRRGRAGEFSLTEEGRRIYSSALDRWERAQERLRASLGRREFGEAHGWLGRLAEAVSEAGTGKNDNERV